MNIKALETILYSSITVVDSLLRQNGFKLSDKESGTHYHNYYYTSLEKDARNKTLIRSLSLMDVYISQDTSRLLLYRTYDKNDQDEIMKQLFNNGYVLIRREGNSYIYRNEIFSVINRISWKQKPGDKPVVSYEFEMGR